MTAWIGISVPARGLLSGPTRRTSLLPSRRNLLIPNFKSCRRLRTPTRAGKLPDDGDVILPPRRAPPVRRIVPFLLTLPRRIDIAFQSSKLNKVTWSLLSILLGFFSSSVITLTFGALSINDILAAVVMLIFYELIDNAFYNPKTKYRPFWLWILNGLKIGVTMGMHADMLKLQGTG